MRNVIETIDKGRRKVNPRYAISLAEAETIIRYNNSSTIEAVNDAFIYGYLQGQKSERACLDNKPPANKNEYRKKVTEGIYQLKSSCQIKQIYDLLQLYIKSFDDNEVLSENDINKLCIINELLLDFLSPQSICSLRYFTYGLEERERKERIKQKEEQTVEDYK